MPNISLWPTERKKSKRSQRDQQEKRHDRIYSIMLKQSLQNERPTYGIVESKSIGAGTLFFHISSTPSLLLLKCREETPERFKYLLPCEESNGYQYKNKK